MKTESKKNTTKQVSALSYKQKSQNKNQPKFQFFARKVYYFILNIL